MVPLRAEEGVLPAQDRREPPTHPLDRTEGLPDTTGGYPSGQDRVVPSTPNTGGFTMQRTVCLLQLCRRIFLFGNGLISRAYPLVSIALSIQVEMFSCFRFNLVYYWFFQWVKEVSCETGYKLFCESEMEVSGRICHSHSFFNVVYQIWWKYTLKRFTWNIYK